MKNVLVIGGSMFTGRVFSIQASRDGGFDLHVVNRGNYPMKLERVAQYKTDRHETDMIAKLVPDIAYDAIVDFCAYNPGDISPIIDAVGDRAKQYIYFSTASIYAPGSGFMREDAPFLDALTDDSGTVDKYILNKIKLERELVDACSGSGVMPTILRPTFIYGPFNYAPRESYFIEQIAKKRAVPVPVDATARFSFVYVFDIARALMACIGDARAYGAVFNLSAPEAVTYATLTSEFERCNNGPFPAREVTVAQADEERLPLPFPLTGDTLVDGGRFSELFDFSYTPFRDGMEKTFRVFYSLYTENPAR